MVTLLIKLLLRFRVALAETTGTVLVVVALAHVATWAALLAVGVVCLLKAFEWETKPRAEDKP